MISLNLYIVGLKSKDENNKIPRRLSNVNNTLLNISITKNIDIIFMIRLNSQSIKYITFNFFKFILFFIK